VLGALAYYGRLVWLFIAPDWQVDRLARLIGDEAIPAMDP
jgi:hypothetical protein